MSSVPKSVKKTTLLVLGGSGYVGQHIIQAALNQNAVMQSQLKEKTTAAAAVSFSCIRSLNRNGKPTRFIDQKTQQLVMNDNTETKNNDVSVEWISGDLLAENNDTALRHAFKDVTAVVSCIGAFGSNAFMEKVCGDTTIRGVALAKESGVKSFLFVSAAPVGTPLTEWLPSWSPLYGYLHGKTRAEASVLESFPKTGIIFRPGFVHGVRQVGSSFSIPLQLIGNPVESLATNCGFATTMVRRLPLIGDALASTISVKTLAQAAVHQVLSTDEKEEKKHIMYSDDIRRSA